MAPFIHSGAIKFGDVKTISDNLGVGQDFFNRVDEAIIEIGANFLDHLSPSAFA